ncbi:MULTISPECIES: ABC transporter permease subunit [Streptomyces]|uniref:Putative ABC transporter integral membrane subunit n=1 Tax=Streptomyces scabiei (strain 87.22) TaxID=680198 RepID=C9Z8C7_STRSW|nr:MULTISPECIES: ABC transporter permease subunit [Streptomyces]MBP5861096.1 ABC transporter permease subunit [Streptomyces sp. LBUM 1484]MBP5869949.1 ABC transporter permease subunit [Streptomyces sp. LBUM 1485]MBP5908348.1 ABC transporter permease subunit [Streptomyces sp. LBUM 1478]MBP5928624.1 ABC transporter permease subunit [Streptomyces sp. LBUM 1479]KFG04452.1 ABC transporter [Streptomyces scabiei]
MSTPQPPLTQAPPAAQWQGAPGTSYTSPIPVVRTHLGHAISSEWTKIKSVRSTIWTLGVFVVLVIGLGLLFALIAASTDMNLEGESPLGLGLFGVMIGSVCILTLGVLTTASEYGTGMIRTTMTACPSRGRVLAAKAIVFFALTFTVTVVTTAFVGFAQTAILEGNGATSPDAGEWFKATVGVSLYLALFGLLALLTGSLIRHSAGAITLMLGVFLAPLVIAIFMFSESLRDVQEFLLEYSIPSQLSVFYGAEISQSGPSGWEPLWIMLALTGVAFVGAYALLEQRDV